MNGISLSPGSACGSSPRVQTTPYAPEYLPANRLDKSGGKTTAATIQNLNRNAAVTGTGVGRRSTTGRLDLPAGLKAGTSLHLNSSFTHDTRPWGLRQAFLCVAGLTTAPAGQACRWQESSTRGPPPVTTHFPESGIAPPSAKRSPRLCRGSVSLPSVLLSPRLPRPLLRNWQTFCQFRSKGRGFWYAGGTEGGVDTPQAQLGASSRKAETRSRTLSAAGVAQEDRLPPFPASRTRPPAWQVLHSSRRRRDPVSCLLHLLLPPCQTPRTHAILHWDVRASKGAPGAACRRLENGFCGVLHGVVDAARGSRLNCPAAYGGVL